jgi:predicted dehydrogenase
MHLFIEKPLSHTVQGLERLKEVVAQQGVYVYVGYMMHFHPLMIQLKQLIQTGRYGRLLSFTTHWGEYLPDWHPWEDYRASYAARRELGGGAALTLSHDLDLVLWLVPSPLTAYQALPNYASALEVNVEGGMDFLLRFGSGTTGHVHLNFFEQPARRYLHFVFETGTVGFDYFAAELQIASRAETRSVKIPNFDRNQLFVDQTIYFLEQLKTFRTEDSIRMIETSAQIIGMCQGA